MVINVKNKLWILFIVILVIAVGITIFAYVNKGKTNNSNYETSKISSNSQNENSNVVNNSNSENTNNSVSIEPIVPPTPVVPKEETISTFSTKIYSSDSERQNNINITCSTLNDTIVKNGETFSFCNTVGQSTSAKGYQKADIFDKDGNKKKGLGGRKLPSKYNFI